MPDGGNVIVIVDDEKGACDYISSFLEDRGYAVFSAFDGRSGLDLIKDRKPAIILLDIRMPGMDGVEVLSKLRQGGESAKVIIITGVEDGEKIDEAKKLGVATILKKPLKLKELSEAISCCAGPG